MKVGGRTRAPAPPVTGTFKADRGDLEALGKAWLRYIKEEAARAAMMSSALPRDPDFYGSFAYKLDGRGVSIYSTWPWFELIMEGTDGPFKMTWLTRPAGVNRVPLRQRDGTLIFRATPLTFADAWVHPGVARHTFVQKAYERAWDEVAQRFIKRALDAAFK